jgi:SagB-type dehydrogenase family enzyme
MKNKEEWRSRAKTHFNKLQDIVTDQMKGNPAPPLQKPYSSESRLFDLPAVNDSIIKNRDIFSCLGKRRSRRKYTDESLSIEELAFLLWFTNGVQKVFKRSEDFSVTLRTVPSAGARHPLETYILANRIAGIDSGLYRYLPLDHKLVMEHSISSPEQVITEATMGQSFVGKALLVIAWSALPYRTEWRYNGEAAKLILLDAGHVCQNLYLAAEALGLGTCGIAAYDQEKIDKALHLDSEEEFVVYLAPVGKL